MEKSDSEIIMKGVEEYFSKEDGKVYRHWRFVGTEKWHKDLTPHKEIPVVKFDI